MFKVNVFFEVRIRIRYVIKVVDILNIICAIEIWNVFGNIYIKITKKSKKIKKKNEPIILYVIFINVISKHSLLFLGMNIIVFIVVPTFAPSIIPSALYIEMEFILYNIEEVMIVVLEELISIEKSIPSKKDKIGDV